ncbi:MAG: ABC transporter ATP-binding protein [Tissierellia bacterium]|nr:ABC transporter ATP-binding protein [Tissierellia bacterium]
MRKILLKSLREYKREAILAPFFVILEVFLEVLIPFMMTKIIDVGIMEKNLPYVLRLGLILVLMAIASLIFGVAAGRTAAIAGAGYGKNLRHDIFYKVQDFSFQNIDHYSSSGLVTRMTTDTTNIQMAFMMTIRILTRTPIMMILSLFMAININKNIASLFLVGVILLAGGLGIIVKVVHPYFRKVFQSYDTLNQVVQENVRGARVVKAYVREDYEIDKFKDVSSLVYRLYTTAQKIVAWNGPLMQFTMYLVILAIFLIGGKAIAYGNMKIGELTAIMVYAMQILISLMMVTFVFVLNIISSASADRIEEILREEPSLANPKHPKGDVKQGDIQFDHVNFRYKNEGKKYILNDINFSIHEGETIGIIGGTGSGKSTLVQLIPRLYDVTEGRILVGGIDVRDYDLTTLRDKVAMVLQKNTLFTGTIKDNIRWGNQEATDEEVQEVCKLAKAHDFIKEFPKGYDTTITQGGTNVSGGQKQRLCIARALLKKPKILILDDSMSAVDTKTESEIRHGLMNHLPNTTKIIISQRISSIEDADRIIVIHEGRIHGFGTSQELLKTNHIYREIYETQLEGGDRLEG